MAQFQPELDARLLKNRLWRLQNLYWIRDAKGNRIPFKLNWAQTELYENLHTCNLVLKARQLGMTTFFCLLSLDAVLFGQGIEAGIIAHTLDDAQNIFQTKIKYPFDQLHPSLRALYRTVGDSAKELAFAHGSTIRVGTSLRSSTLQYLHISEFGKICAKYPERAREIITGSLNTVAPGQNISIESTAEGKEGAFYEMVQAARKKTENLSPVDFRFHFFPWWRHPLYRLEQECPLSGDLRAYFDKLALDGILLEKPQQYWYASKWAVQKEDTYREFPSTPDEAFAASQEGFWYASEMKALWDGGRITKIGYDKALPVHTAWDLGQADHTAIWFFQINRSDDVHLIDFWQKTSTRLDLVAHMLQAKGYVYGRHIWPTDAKARDRSGITFVEQARALNISGMVLDPHALLQGISLVKTTFSRCWFDETKCMEGIRCLESYKKTWSPTLGGWTSQPYHDDNSHAADAFRYLCCGVSKLSGASRPLEQDFSLLRKFWGG